MTKKLLFQWVGWAIATGLVLGCMPEDETFTSDPSLRLHYSTDTVSYDTIITDLESITLRFRVYNPNKQSIRISSIGLSNPNSPYSLTINALEGKSFTNVPIIGGDSLLILIKLNTISQNRDSLYLIDDDILFRYHDNQDAVKVVAWGRDATIITEETLACNTVWTAGKPYFINDYILIDSLCTLSIQEGTKILMGNDAAIFVKGSLHIKGSASAPVSIRNIRTDKAFNQVAGQWDAIYFLEGSKGNIIDHAEIMNGTIGLRIGSPDDDEDFDVIVSHSIIKNMSVAGILAFSSDVYAFNVQINNCKNYLVGNFIGGNYVYEHCTFSNFPTDFFRQEASVQFSDVLFVENNQPLVAPLDVRMVNCIVWGNEREEILVSNAGKQEIKLDIVNNIIRSIDPIWTTGGNFISQERNFPGFKAPVAGNFQLDSLAQAINKGIPIGIEFDLLKSKRDTLPDIGAYEWVPKEK